MVSLWETCVIHFEFVLPLPYSVGKGQREILLSSQVSKHNPIFTVLAPPRAALLRQTKVRWGGGSQKLECVWEEDCANKSALMASLRTSLLPDAPWGLSPSTIYCPESFQGVYPESFLTMQMQGQFF